MADLKTLCIDGECRNIPQPTVSGVTGVKGQQEANYRTGDVNLSLENIAYIGNNPTGGIANDTKAFWKEKGTCYATITSNNQVNGQPAQYGILISYSYGSNMLAQYFLVTGSGAIYRRGNNAAATTTMPEFVAVDNDTQYTAGTNLTLSGTEFSLKTSPALSGTPTTPNISDKSTSTTQIANSAFVQGAINRRLPKSLTISIDNTTAVSLASSANATGWELLTAPSTGLFIGWCSVTFAANATGFRYIDFQALGGQKANAAASGQSQLSTAIVRRVAEGTKYSLRAAQTSGSALQVTRRQIYGYIIED